MENCTDLSYSKHSLAFAEYACNNFSYYRDKYRQLKWDIENDILFRFTSKEVNTKINLYRPSNTTAEAAVKLATLENDNKELKQLNLMVAGIEKAFKKFSESTINWMKEHLIDKNSANEKNKKYSVDDKRMRRYVLSNICYWMGLPEDKYRK